MLKYISYDVVFQEIPDEVTLAIYISNCPYRCIGCHSAFMRKNIGIILDKNELCKLIYKYENAVTCICFMGGDSEPIEIYRLASYICELYGNKYSIAWYSGNDKIPENFDIRFFKYIKLGPYIDSLGGLRSRNTNQRLYKLDNGALNDITNIFWR